MLDKSLSGEAVEITFLIFDDHGDIIAHADRNNYWIRSDTRVEKPDRGRLLVYDHKDRLILEVEFLNRNAIRVSGVLRHPDFPNQPVPIEVPNMRNNCSFGSTNAIRIGLN